jgi:hypothetical protein
MFVIVSHAIKSLLAILLTQNIVLLPVVMKYSLKSARAIKPAILLSKTQEMDFKSEMKLSV